MKSVLLIGLGRFGRHLAMQLNELGHQVMAVDKDEERVNECMPFVTNAQIGDSTPSLKSPYRRIGRAAASASWTSAENTVSTSSA